MPILSLSVFSARRWSWSLSLGAVLAVAGTLMAVDARAELADGKYGAAQVFDVQRSPGFPVAGQNFRVSSFKRPYRSTAPGGQYTMEAGQYIQFFRAANYNNPTNCTYGIRLYNADGSLASAIADAGKVYGLGNEGFLHVSDSGFGTFVANSAGYALGGSLNYTPTTGEANCDQLAAYVPNTTPTDTPGPTGPAPAPTLSGVGVTGVGETTATLNVTSSANGQGYWVVVPQGSATPTAAQVKAGVNYGAVSVAAAGSGAMTAATGRTFPVTGLSPGTAYTAYLIAEDATPTPSTVSSVNFSTSDLTPPAIVNPPAAGGVSYTGATVGVTVNENGTGYWVVLPATEPTPTPAELLASGATVALTGGTPASIPLSGLTPSTAYVFHFVVRDAAGNIQPTVTSLPITTPTPPAKTVSGTAPGGLNIGVAMSGGDLSCGLANTTFQAPEALGAVRMPAGYVFPYGVFGFTTTSCGTGTTVTLTLTYPQALPAGTKYLKYGPTSDNPTPHWYEFPVTINGNQITLTITDNGAGDSNPAPGVITDPGGPITLATLAPVPTLSEWMLALLSTLMAASLFVAARRRG